MQLKVLCKEFTKQKEYYLFYINIIYALVCYSKILNLSLIINMENKIQNVEKIKNGKKIKNYLQYKYFDICEFDSGEV